MGMNILVVRLSADSNPRSKCAETRMRFQSVEHMKVMRPTFGPIFAGVSTGVWGKQMFLPILYRPVA